MSTDDFLRLVYASFSAVHDGKAEEVMLDHTADDVSIQIIINSRSSTYVADESREG